MATTSLDPDPTPPRASAVRPGGWLFGQEPLFAVRAQGNTCIASLRAQASFGDPARNDSKGCGGLTRMAPIGLERPHQPGFRRHSGALNDCLFAVSMVQVLTHREFDRTRASIAESNKKARPWSGLSIGSVVNPPD